MPRRFEWHNIDLRTTTPAYDQVLLERPVSLMGCTTLTQDWGPIFEHRRARHYYFGDNIFGQTAAALIVPIPIAALWTLYRTFNLATEAGIYQSPEMPINVWKPIKTHTLRFKYLHWRRAYFYCVAFYGPFAFGDAVCGKLRQRDDWLNTIVGGLSGAAGIWAIQGNMIMCLGIGLMYAFLHGTVRFTGFQRGAPKSTLDFNLPHFGLQWHPMLHNTSRSHFGVRWTEFDSAPLEEQFVQHWKDEKFPYESKNHHTGEFLSDAEKARNEAIENEWRQPRDYSQIWFGPYLKGQVFTKVGRWKIGNWGNSAGS